MKASRSCKDYDPELYQKVKEAVSMQQAAEYCGLKVVKGLCLCPFHPDRKPSLRIYPDGKGYYCFACGAGGDQVKLVAQCRGVTNYEAAKELASAFGIPVQVPVTYREKREAEKKRRERQELQTFANRSKMYLTAYRSLLCEAIRARDGHFWEGLGSITYVEYLLDCLENCPGDVYADKKVVKKIEQVEKRITDWFSGPESGGALSG